MYIIPDLVRSKLKKHELIILLKNRRLGTVLEGWLDVNSQLLFFTLN